MIRFVCRNLWHQKMRTLVGAGGVAFATLLVFVQLGFSAAAETLATRMLARLDCDLLVAPANYLNLNAARTFPAARLEVARGHPDVERVAHLYVGWGTWRLHDSDQAGQRRSILIVALDPDDGAFLRPGVLTPDEPCSLDRLRLPETVLMDANTRDYFTPRQKGGETELNGTRVRVEGTCNLGTNLGADGLVLVSPRTCADVCGPATAGRATLGLIKLQDSSPATVRRVRDEIRRGLLGGSGDEVRVWTRDEFEERERVYWMDRTSVGLIFTLGVLVACLVGVVFVYQVISGDVASRFNEYATLKAIGYRDRHLAAIVLGQALVLAVLGYLPALLASWFLYAGARWTSHKIPMEMTAGRVAGVLLLAALLCAISGLFALRKVRAADPADLL
jgi:putative ABC transport system permease protein